jgi:hypothetical protein
MRRIVVVLALLVLPGVASAQSAATAPAYVTFPWALGRANPSGVFLRNLWVPPQTVVVDRILEAPSQPPETNGETDSGTPAPAPQSAPQYVVLRQTAVVPGYWVTETTTGFLYPQRWMLEQLAPGAYQWRLLPAEARAR